MGDILEILAPFGGISLVIWTSAKAKMMHRMTDRAQWQQQVAPRQDDAVLAELKSLKQQMNEMHSTANGFNIALDSAVSRLEERVGRLETRDAARTGQSVEGQIARVGRP